jgi:hypothetical protein
MMWSVTGVALRLFACAFFVLLISVAVRPLLPPHPLALHLIVVAALASLSNIALAWRAGSDATRLAIVLGLSLVLMIIGLTLVMPGAWGA